MSPNPTNLDTTDYFALCRAGVMTRLQQLQGIFPQSYQVTTNRFKINAGADNWAIFLPSTFQSSKLGSHDKHVVWSVWMDLYVRYKTEEESVGKFEAVRSAIFNWLHADPTLNKTRGVSDVAMATRTELLQDIPGDNPTWLIQTMSVNVTQRISFNY